MGFLSSLTDAFTGAPAKQAAADTRGYLGGVQTTGNNAIDTGALNARSGVSAGLTAGRDALSGGYSTSRGDVGAGADSAIGYIGSGRDAALGYLDKGYGDASGLYDSARGAYAPLSALGTKYGAATTLGLNALGANGAGGQTSARDAFTAGPGYSFNRDQGLEAINRRRNMGGMLDSGNADRDAQTFGAGLASNEYDKWLTNLLGFTSPELQATSGAASGVAGVNATQAGAVNQFGQNKAGIATDAATAGAGVSTGRAAMLSDLASRYGLNSANQEASAGNTLAGIETGAAGQKVGLGASIAQPYSNTYGQEAAASQQGSGNLWNLGINAAKLATGQAGRAAA